MKDIKKERQEKVNLPTIAFVLFAVFIVWYFNQPINDPEPTYSMPVMERPARSFNYETGEWNYYEEQQQRTYTQRQVDSIKRYAKNMQPDFEDDMEDYLQDHGLPDPHWGD